jgi:hypothetical protein
MDSSSPEHSGFETGAWLGQVRILGFEAEPEDVTLVTVEGDHRNLEFVFSDANRVLTVQDPGVNIGDQFEIRITV